MNKRPASLRIGLPEGRQGRNTSLFTHKRPFVPLDAESQEVLCLAGLGQASPLSGDEMRERDKSETREGQELAWHFCRVGGSKGPPGMGGFPSEQDQQPHGGRRQAAPVHSIGLQLED